MTHRSTRVSTTSGARTPAQTEAPAQTQIPDGIYFAHEEGRGWTAMQFAAGHLAGTAEEANAATHLAANDFWAGIIPTDLDVEVGQELAAAIVRAWNPGVSRLPPSSIMEMVVIERHSSSTRSMPGNR
jgi:hypothetical protein